MVGCRFNAKNTLDRNYLYLAEKGGARVFPDTLVVDIEPAAAGYRISARHPGAWIRKRRRMFTADQVVVAAGALGTTRLLLELKERNRLPGLSHRVGHLVRTNSESLVGAVAKDRSVDYSRGVAITSSFHPDSDTRIEPVRYPAGSNAMGVLSAILVAGGGRGPQWLRFLGMAARHPITFFRSLSNRHWSERTVILLVMQSIDNSIRLFRGPGRLFRKRTRLRSAPGHGRPNPRWIPVGHEAARAAAGAMNGFPQASINESLLGIPITAHVLGGAAIGAAPESGVIDPYHRVFGQPGLHVVDGGAVPANLGSNPSLTITALAERAMAMWPNTGEDDPRPPLGDPYRRVAPTSPRHPAVPAGASGALRLPDG
jgi:cholesterol oxidase